MKTWLAIGLGTLGAWVFLMVNILFHTMASGVNFVLTGFDLLVGQQYDFFNLVGYKVAVWVATIALLGVSAYSFRKAIQAERKPVDN